MQNFILLIRAFIKSRIYEAPKSASKQEAPIQFEHAGDAILRTKEAAKLLGISVQTIYKNSWKIPHMKRFGKLYFKKSELIAYLENNNI